MIATLLNIPCEVRTPTTDTDIYGDEVAAGYTSVRTYCYTSTGSASESTDTGQQTSAEWTVYLQPDTAVTSTSVVVLNDGRQMEATHPPRIMVNARTGQASHIELRCRQVV